MFTHIPPIDVINKAVNFENVIQSEIILALNIMQVLKYQTNFNLKKLYKAISLKVLVIVKIAFCLCIKKLNLEKRRSCSFVFKLPCLLTIFSPIKFLIMQ